MFTYKRMNDTLVVFDFTPCFQHDVLDNIAGIIHKDMGADTMVLTSNTEKLLKSKVTHEMISALKQACEEYDYIVVSGKVAADILMFTSEYRNPVFKIEGCSLSPSDIRNQAKLTINSQASIPRGYSDRVRIPKTYTKDQIDSFKKILKKELGATRVEIEECKVKKKPLFKTQTEGIFQIVEQDNLRITMTEGPKYWQTKFWDTAFSVLAYDIMFVRHAKKFETLDIATRVFQGGVDELKSMFENREDKEPFSLDIETTGIQPWKKVDLTNSKSQSIFGDRPSYGEGSDHTIISVSFSLDGKTGYSFCIDHPKSPNPLGLDLLRYLMEAPFPKIIHNGKFEYSWICLYYDIPINGKIYDTQLIEHVIAENLGKATSRYSLAGLTARRLLVEPHKSEFQEEMKTGIKKRRLQGKSDLSTHKIEEIANICYHTLIEVREKDFTKISIRKLHEYGAYDSAVTYKIFRKQITQLKKLKMKRGAKILAGDLHNRMSQVLGTMEYTGMQVDPDAVLEIVDSCDDIAQEKSEDLEKQFGNQWNFSSNKDMTALIETHHPKLANKLPVNTRGDFQLDQDIIDFYSSKYPFLTILSDYRHARKARGTYMVPFLQYSSKARVHFSFNISGTATGRLSSRTPNVQNIPEKIKGIPIKQVLKPEPDHALFNMDLATAELKILAMYSRDKNMLTVINEGGDLHSYTASAVFEEPYEEILEAKTASVKTERQQRLVGLRKKAKPINFGIVYGISPRALGSDIGIDEYEAEEYMEKYFARYRGVASFLRKCKNIIKTKGYIETYFGRRRNFPLAMNPKTPFWIGSKMERQAMNFVIQSTTSDWLQFLLWDLCQVDGVIPHLTVHDSLVFSYKGSFRFLKKKFNEILIEKPREMWPKLMAADVGYDLSIGLDYGHQIELTPALEESLIEATDNKMSIPNWIELTTS